MVSNCILLLMIVVCGVLLEEIMFVGLSVILFGCSLFVCFGGVWFECRRNECLVL